MYCVVIIATQPSIGMLNCFFSGRMIATCGRSLSPDDSTPSQVTIDSILICGHDTAIRHKPMSYTRTNCETLNLILMTNKKIIN